MLVPDPTGCAECGMAYSFFFSTQYHRTDCPVALADDLARYARMEQGEFDPPLPLRADSK